MANMSEAYRNKFLSKTQYGYLTTLKGDGSPITVPVWFDWDGHTIRMFTGQSSPKVGRIQKDPRVTLLVSNEINEYEAWVAFDGQATIRLDESIGEFLDQLASRYWDLSDPKRKMVLDSWKANPEQFYVLELVPTRIRTYYD